MIKDRCPITYETIADNEKYSVTGLKLLSPKLTTLNDINLSAKEQRIEARKRADKMSVQGVQAKLSAVLSIKDESFNIVDNNGKYILKPQSEYYPELPENEDLTMRLARVIGIEIPLHGLVYSKDESLTYFIKRFDRTGHIDKIPLEDFAQLAGKDRETKYNFSMEKLIVIIDKFCTFPLLEKKILLERTLFNFMVGNEDMHLKNFSLITTNSIVKFSPAYDLVNSTIAKLVMHF